MTSYTLDVTWDIADPTIPLGQLRDEAINLIRRRAHREGWTLTRQPTTHINHGHTPTLRLTVPIHTPAEAAA